MGSGQVGGEAEMGEGGRVSVERCKKFGHICQTVVVFGSQCQGVEVV